MKDYKSLYDEAVNVSYYEDTIQFLKKQDYIIERNSESITRIIPPSYLNIAPYVVTCIEVKSPEDVPEELADIFDFEDLGNIYNETEVLTQAHQDFIKKLRSLMNNIDG